MPFRGLDLCVNILNAETKESIFYLFANLGRIVSHISLDKETNHIDQQERGVNHDQGAFLNPERKCQPEYGADVNASTFHGNKFMEVRMAPAIVTAVADHFSTLFIIYDILTRYGIKVETIT